MSHAACNWLLLSGSSSGKVKRHVDRSPCRQQAIPATTQRLCLFIPSLRDSLAQRPVQEAEHTSVQAPNLTLGLGKATPPANGPVVAQLQTSNSTTICGAVTEDTRIRPWYSCKNASYALADSSKPLVAKEMLIISDHRPCCRETSPNNCSREQPNCNLST